MKACSSKKKNCRNYAVFLRERKILTITLLLFIRSLSIEFISFFFALEVYFMNYNVENRERERETKCQFRKVEILMYSEKKERIFLDTGYEYVGILLLSKLFK